MAKQGLISCHSAAKPSHSQDLGLFPVIIPRTRLHRLPQRGRGAVTTEQPPWKRRAWTKGPFPQHQRSNGILSVPYPQTRPTAPIFHIIPSKDWELGVFYQVNRSIDLPVTCTYLCTYTFTSPGQRAPSRLASIPQHGSFPPVVWGNPEPH